MRKTVYIFIGFLILFTSCDYFQFKNNNNVNNESPIARVGDKKLYANDLSHLYNANLSHEDSLRVRALYIENWAQNQIFIQKASLNLPKDKKEEFDRMLTNYKNDLYINYYKEAVLSQSLDTIITQSEIDSFYKANKEIFRLNEKLLQVKKISYKTNSFKDWKIKKLFIKNDKESIDKLLENEVAYNTVELNDSIWNLHTDFLKENPIFKKKHRKIQRNQFYLLKDTENTYMFFIKKILSSKEIAPLEYVRPVVKKMILHKKKLEHIKNFENNLIKDAIQNKIYEKYE